MPSHNRDTNSAMSQLEYEADLMSLEPSVKTKMCFPKLKLVFTLFLIGRESGANFAYQRQSVVKYNQGKDEN